MVSGNIIYDELDRITAFVALFLSVSLLVWLLTTGRLDRTGFSSLYIFSLTLFSFVCVTYLAFIRRRLSVRSTTDWSQGANRTLLKAFDFLFVALFLLSVTAICLRSESYVRPTLYFLSIVGLVAVLAVELSTFKLGSTRTFVLLFKTLVIGLSLEISAQIIFPSVVGIDPWWHQWFVTSSIEQGHLVEGNPYSKMPLLQLTTGSAMLLANVDYKSASMLAITSAHVLISVTAVFLLGRLVAGSNVGLLGGLLLSVADQNVKFGEFAIPNTYAAMFAILLCYVLLKFGNHLRLPTKITLTIIMIVIVLGHSLTALWVAVLIALLWLGYRFFQAVNPAESKNPVPIGMFVLFVAIMMFWWMYVSGYYLNSLIHMAMGGFSRDVVTGFSSPSSAILESRLSVPVPEQIFAMAGFITSLAIAAIGCLFMVSRRFGKGIGMQCVLCGFSPIAIGFFGLVLGASGAEDRWFLFGQTIMTVPLAVSLFLIAGLARRKWLRRAILPVIVAILSILMVFSPSSDFDNRVLSPHTGVRYALTENELQSSHLLLEMQNGSVGADSYYCVALTFLSRMSHEMNVSFRIVSDNLYNKSLDRLDNTLLVVRDEIVNHAFDGGVNLGYDPRISLDSMDFSRVYDSGTVTAFLKSQ